MRYKSIYGLSDHNAVHQSRQEEEEKLFGSVVHCTAMTPSVLLVLLLGVAASAVSLPLPAPLLPTHILSAYEVLQSYDFPIGLLPKGVVGYKLDKETGAFEAYLDGTCSFSLENSYQLRYQSTITGVITSDKLTNLEGVSVKVLFFWLNIIEVTRHGDSLRFSVGIISADFSIDDFYESPQCGCGFDCVNQPARALRGTF